MKKNILFICFLSAFLPLLASCTSKSEKAIKIVQEGSIEEYPSLIIKDGVAENFLSTEWSATESLDCWLVTFKGCMNANLFNGFFEELGTAEMAYTFKVDLSSKVISVDSFAINGDKITANDKNYENTKKFWLAILFNDEDAFAEALMDVLADSIPFPKDGYTSSQREILEWYTTLGQIETETCDDNPSRVIIDFAFGYKNGNIVISTKLKENAAEIKELIKDFINTKTSDYLRNPNNEDALQDELKNLINTKIFNGNGIREVVIQQKDVIRDE